MPVFKDVEVWIEDSQHRKIDHQEVSIDLIDDRTVTVKTAMFRDELYTVHCQSPVSVFCEVFILTPSCIRKHAARFCLDSTGATSKDVSGSSEDHAMGQFQERGLRTPKRQYQQGKLASVDVEIRRVGRIVKCEPREECESDGEEGPGVADVCMIDDFGELPWLLFHFDISAKEPLEVPIVTAKSGEKLAPRRTPRNQRRGTRGGPFGSITKGLGSKTSCETNHECLQNGKRQRMYDGSISIDGNQGHVNLTQLEEYKKEEAEERRLMRMLQQRLHAKRTRNLELRRLLGEYS